MGERYIARPVHLYTQALPFLILGTAVFGLGWEILGIVLASIGVGAAIWIVVRGILQTRMEYFDSLSYDMKLMSQIQDPDVWAVIGYDKPKTHMPQLVRTEQEFIAPNTLPKLEFPTPPATVPQMRMVANSWLRGGSMAEAEWAGDKRPFSTPQIRKLKRWMESKGYLKLRNPSAPTLGFLLTERGEQFLLTYADVELQQLFSKRVGEVQHRQDLLSEGSK